MGRITNISKHLNEREIKQIYKSCSNYKDKLRLLAVMNLYNGKTMTDTADYLMMSYSNLKQFIKRWNEEGVGSLDRGYVIASSNGNETGNETE